MYKNKLWSDLKTDMERVEFLLSGRAHETGIIAQSIIEDVASAFAYRAENESKNMGCFVDYDPKYPLDYHKYCLHDVGKDCSWSNKKDNCKYWRPVNNETHTSEHN